jgi:hypothetical protein
MSAVVLAALIGATGTVLAALIERVHRVVRRSEAKIDGLKNGTYTQAMAAIAEIQREREEVRLRGLTPRRRIDRIVEEPDRGVH